MATALALVGSACGSDNETSSSATTSATQTTSTATGSTSTVAGSTTAAPSTSAPATITVPPTTAPGPTVTQPAAPAADAVLAVTSQLPDGLSVLTLHTAVDGAAVRRAELGYEGFVYSPSFASEQVVVNSNYEDYWFSCPGYNGLIREVLPDGSSEEILEGGLAEVSDDGAHLAYATASTCGPDEVDPGNWVHAPLDTVVWRNLATNQEQAWQFPGAVLDSDTPTPLTSMTLAGDQIVALVSGQLQVLDTTGSELATAPVDIDVSDGGFISLLGVRPDGRVVALREAGAQAGARIVEFDPATGAETDVVSYPNDVRAAALDRSGIHLAVLTDGELTIDGAPVALEGVDTADITSIGW
ncbi:MAG: hypothetical protein ACR2QE_21445 [Acidimicrobiales bacterium]